MSSSYNVGREHDFRARQCHLLNGEMSGDVKTVTRPHYPVLNW